MQKNSLRRSDKAMEYEVILSAEAKEHFRKIIHHLLYSGQAANSVADDMEETIERLSHVAGNLKLCDHPRLRAQKFQTIHFKHHRYFMLYRIADNQVRVYGIYHDLQDYENILR